ncbi:MAG: U32 family peptidase [Vallitalea sp.]|jgi:putative protease|nr:U32 family peptidase [Vallitalea sp.]
MINKPELLSPAGSFQSLIAAINSGCDAVYVGGKQFSARAYASNFDIDELIKAIDYCHLRGVKIYLTVNTLFKEKEIDELLKYINIMYQSGVDALIIQDFGTAMLIKETFKDLEIHASTQMSIHNLEGVKYLNKLGFSRVVLSRETDINEIKHIINNTDTEIECFVHGALCYSYSGQCLMSSILGGRSGNRGRCAGTCRLPYSLLDNNKIINNNNQRYLLSPKDICTIDIINELIQTGIHSFKIEGRMKSPEYVAGVTSIYRKYIDFYLTNINKFKTNNIDKEQLLDLYNRGGFSKGYFTDKNNQIMSMNKPNNQGSYIGKVINVNSKKKNIQIILDKQVMKGDKLEIWTGKEPQPSYNISKTSDNNIITIREYNKNIVAGNKVYRTRNQTLLNNIKEQSITNNKKQKISGYVKCQLNSPITIELEYNGYHVAETGSIVEQAKNQSLSTDRIIKQIKKTGDYPFDIEIVESIIDENIFIPISEINKLRRSALDKLSETIINECKREKITLSANPEKVYEKNINIDNKIKVLIRSKSQLETIIKYNIDSVYLESELIDIKETKEIIQIAKLNNMKVYIALPRIFNKSVQDKYMPKLDKIRDLNFDGYLIRTYGEKSLINDTTKEIIIDYNMNVFNNKSILSWKQEGAYAITLSPELNYREMNSLNTENAEIVIYGYLPLMVSKQCVVNNVTKNERLCYNKKKYYLKDRYNKEFYVDRRCDNCYNIIYNSSVLMLFDQINKIRKEGISNLRLEFTNETNTQIERVMTLIVDLLNNKQLSTEQIIKKLNLKEFNRGHFIRGIE